MSLQSVRGISAERLVKNNIKCFSAESFGQSLVGRSRGTDPGGSTSSSVLLLCKYISYIDKQAC